MNRRDFFKQLAGAAFANEAARSEPPSHPMLDDCPEWLRTWRLLPRFPVWESAEPAVTHLLQALHANAALSITYHGGSQPGRSRRFTPAGVFRVAEEDEAPLYVCGWCHERMAFRTLRLDRLHLADLPSTQGSSYTQA
jgi:predicted DNA-binding transcriptional regulator YafY